MKKIVFVVLLIGLLSVSSFFGVKYYSYLFAKVIVGEVFRVERVSPADSIIASKNTPASQLFSFSVAMRDSKGEIHVATTEDRQWAVVSPGQCAEARFFRYPPWQLDKAGTFFGARLERLFECDAGTGVDPRPTIRTEP